MTTATSPDAAPVQADATASPQERTPARAWYALFALIFAGLVGFIDARILVLLAQTIKGDLSLTDLQIGETHGLMPALFMLITTYPLAWCADRFERRTVLAICVIFWSLATAASGLATDFTTLLACTIAIVIGEAGFAPICYSLIADLFPPKRRPLANIIMYGATVLGAGLGTTLGGVFIGVTEDLRPLLPVALQHFESWRLTFFLVALPGPLVALAVFLIGRTKRQTATSQPTKSSAPMGPYLKQHGWVALGTYGAWASLSFALIGVSNWLPVAMIRIYEADAATVGIGFGLAFTVGAAVGLIMAAVITPYVRRVAGTAFVLRALSISAAAAAVPTFLFGFTTELWHNYVLISFWAASFVTGVALIPGMMQDIAPFALRTRVIAVGTTVNLCVGYLSPPLIGLISDQIPDNPRGLIWAMIALAGAGFVACAALARFMEAPYRRTVAAVAEGERTTP
jgi:hypothetical protein